MIAVQEPSLWGVVVPVLSWGMVSLLQGGSCGPGSVHRAQSSGSWERHAWGTAGVPAACRMALPSVRVVFEVQKGHSPFTCLSLEAGGCDLSPS